MLVQAFSEPDFQGQEGFSKVQNLIDVLTLVMLEKEGFKVNLITAIGQFVVGTILLFTTIYRQFLFIRNFIFN